MNAIVFMITRVATFLILLYLPCCAYSDAVNYCNDPKVNQQWSRLMLKYGDIPEWKDINRYRVQLCKEVNNGIISLEEAIGLFEDERIKKIEQLKRRLEKTTDADYSLSG